MDFSLAWLLDRLGLAFGFVWIGFVLLLAWRDLAFALAWFFDLAFGLAWLGLSWLLAWFYFWLCLALTAWLLAWFGFWLLTSLLA